MGIKQVIKKVSVVNNLNWGISLFQYYRNEHRECSALKFILQNVTRLKSIYPFDNKWNQIEALMNSVDILPNQNSSFFYSIDVFKRAEQKNHMMDNYSIDYSWVVNSCFYDMSKMIDEDSYYRDVYQGFIAIMQRYLLKIKSDNIIERSFKRNIAEIESLFTRPAEHLHEAIQRILFVNQWLWQTGHKHNGFGHLDWILYKFYKEDIASGYITKEDAKQYLHDFFKVLHDKCWFKSTMLLGDTGQIVILGGLGEDGKYRCNELTYLFIEVSKELKLPDPKVLLRVSKRMPDNLIALAMECIATGIGAPFLSNDDIVISALIQYGYEPEDAYNYVTSACWEPLTIGKSCDQNNIRTINFCKPFVEYLDSDEFEKNTSIESIKNGYYRYLSEYINQFLCQLDEKIFEEDPLLTLFNPEVYKTGKDIVRGGAKYANLGVTSVGLSSVVNSLKNINKLVFEEQEYSVHELNEIRKNNYEGYEELRKRLYQETGAFGEDDLGTIELTNEILQHISIEFRKHHTKLGGEYKFGLSSPNYIVDARNIGATFDGRKAGMPFGTHISGKNGLAPTELISFASQLNYNDNRINGNVIDFIMPPGFLKSNMDKVITMIKAGIRQGFYQLQINVVDSQTLIEAQKHPENFPDLVVRVWGFSAYFKDLPKDYQDNLIRRAIEAEKTS